jgi:uncharacterized membrane protein YvbJ
MDKKCSECGHITKNENALYCERCGKPFLRSEETSKGVVWRADTPYEFSDTIRGRKAARFIKANGRKKKLFALAFIGLLLDFIFGIGAVICLPVAIVASIDAAIVYAERKKLTTWHLWAMVVGYLGSLFGLAFFILII